MRKPAFWLTMLIATLCLSVGAAVAQQIGPTGTRVLVNRDNVNVRLFPAIGAEVLGFVDAGFTAQVYARSADSQWVRVNFLGEEGWIGVAVLTVLDGDINSAPVADPRTIPYGGFESPRAGTTSATSPVQGRLVENGVRVRAGPSRSYPILANAPRRTEFSLLGRAYDNRWLQVNFEGTLGWVSATEVTIIAGDINSLPVDGITAESLPLSTSTANDFLALLRLMRDRVNLAQPSLDAIRATWTNVALGGQAPCGNYPAQPTGINIALPLLAAYVNTLDPLQRQFNDAMANVRNAITLLIDACSFGTSSIGEATVRGALDIVNLADTQFAQLRQRLAELIPPEREPGPNECLFMFGVQGEILPRLDLGRAYVDHYTPRDTISGYCFDATQGQTLTVTIVPLTGNLVFFIAVSPIDNPTNFLAVSTISPTSVGATVSFSATITGRYLIIATDRGDLVGARALPPEGDFGIAVYPSGTQVDTASAIDLATGQAAQGYDLSGFTAPVLAPTPLFIQPTIISPGTPFSPVVTQSVATTPMSPVQPINVFCPGLNLQCNQLTCEQARACLQAGNFTLDPDNDFIPCEETGCT